MAKVALIGDLHIDNRNIFGGSVNFMGQNERLVNIVQYTRYMLQAIDRNHPEVKSVIFMGDITHRHGVLTPPVSRGVEAVLWALDHYGDKTVFYFDGNHDVDGFNNSCIDIFDGIGTDSTCKYIPRHDTSRNNGPVIFPMPRIGFFLPWGKELSSENGTTEFKKKLKEIETSIKDFKTFRVNIPKILYTHVHFSGAVTHGLQYTPSGGIDPDVIDDIMIFSGHIHKHQVLANGSMVYVGVPLQHTFGEESYRTGYVLLDTETKEWEFVDYDEAPKFWTVDLGDDIPGRFDVDYYKFLYDPAADYEEELNSYMSKVQKSTTEPKTSLTPDIRSRVQDAIADEEKETGDITIQDIMKAHVILNVKEKDRQEKFIEAGKKLLGGNSDA